MMWRHIRPRNLSPALSRLSRVRDRTSERSWTWPSIGSFWNRVWTTTVQCFFSATFMRHSRSSSTSTRTTSGISQKKRVLNCIMETLYSGFIDAFVVKQVEEISAEWRLASHRLKDEPHNLWYLLKHILASKFTYLFRAIPPGFTQPLADCLTHLHRETCEILAQCETIPDISFDLARIREGTGLGYADDFLDSAFAASKIASLRRSFNPPLSKRYSRQEPPHAMTRPSRSRHVS